VILEEGGNELVDGGTDGYATSSDGVPAATFSLAK
jgi:hypothetical protein